MSKKTPGKNELISFRLTKELKDALQREATIEGLDLTAYIRRLLITDPRRKKKA